MKGILQKLLRKKGIETISELSEEEQATFNKWEKVLSKDKLTIDDIKEFCATQVDIIEGKWTDYSLESEKKAELIPYHTVYRTLLSAIDAPRSAREALEQQLNQLTLND